jgi:hypothetical protein
MYFLAGFVLRERRAFFWDSLTDFIFFIICLVVSVPVGQTGVYFPDKYNSR